MPPLRSLLAATALLVLGGAMAGCATRPPASDPEALAEFRANNDPLEPTNRAMYEVNDAIDRAVLRPVAQGYRAVVPAPVRTGIRNVLGNLASPVILFNDALQGETQRFGTTLGRILLNSTIGIAGIFDVASDLGLPPHGEDFGQTFAVAGIEEGPYLFLPLLGPSNPRDIAGLVVGIFADPLTWFTFGSTPGATAFGYARTGTSAVSAREALLDPLDDLRRNSLDPYATIRSGYRQQRQRDIANVPAPVTSPETASTGLLYRLGVRPNLATPPR